MEAIAHNTPALKQQRDRENNTCSSSGTVAPRNRKGFSLIEAAIVLAVVGGVIGAIWVSAAAVIENYKVNKTVEEIFTTAKNIQNLISSRDAETIGMDVAITDEMRNAGALPENWISGNGYMVLGSNYLSIQNKVSYITLRFGSPNNSGQPSVSVCTKLTVRLSNMLAMEKSQLNTMFHITMGYASGYSTFTTFPISLTSAETACKKLSNADSNRLFSVGINFTRINN